MSDELRSQWAERSREMGATRRSVLFKRLPRVLNWWIHHQHVRFIRQNLRSGHSRILDVGCGYGRLSEALKATNASAEFHGVDFTPEFARQFELRVGPCYCGSVFEFESEIDYDVVLAVTILMYIEPAQQRRFLEKLWGLVAPGGCLILIEPAVELMRMFRLLTGKKDANPTGGSVSMFSASELRSAVLALSGGRLVASKGFTGFPMTTFVPVHHGIVVSKGPQPDG